MTRIYISGAMSGIEGMNFPAFRAAAEQLRAAGYDVEDPSEKGIVEEWSWGDYLRHDLRLILDCDGLAMLPGWLDSRGANLEVYVAKQLGILVRPIDCWLRLARASTAEVSSELES